MILFSLCNFVCAQETDSQCNEGCVKQTLDLTSDQIETLLGYDGSFDVTSDEIEELLGPDESANLTSDNGEAPLGYDGSFNVTSDEIEEPLGPDESSNLTSDNGEAPLGSHKSPRYEAIVNLKSDQTKLKYSEHDLDLTDGLELTIEVSCPVELSEEVQPMRLKKEENGEILIVEIAFDGPCYSNWNLIFGSDATISHSRQRLTNLDMIMEVYRDQHHKKHHRDKHR
jgi:hypothetical protein